MTKSELLQWLQEEYQQWEAFLEEIGPARMDQPGVTGEWSVKDIVAHLTGWNRWLVARIPAAERDEPEPPTPWSASLQTEDEINAWMYETNRGRSVHQVLEESHRVFQELLAVIEGLRYVHIESEWHLVWPDDLLFPAVFVIRKRLPAGEFFDHFHDDHEPDVRAWLAREEKH